MAPIPRLKAHDGPAILSYGFRPLTAIPNWTGRRPLQGRPLIVAFAGFAALYGRYLARPRRRRP